MEKKLLGLFLVAVIFLGTLGFAAAYDANNPYTVTMNFIVGQDTSFTVSLAGSETTIDFNPPTMNSKNVEPDSQSASSNTPMVIVTNTGNVNLKLEHSVTSALPSWVQVCWNTANTINWANLLSATKQSFASSVAPGNSVNLFFWANFTSAAAGTHSRTYKIESSVAS